VAIASLPEPGALTVLLSGGLFAFLAFAVQKRGWASCGQRFFVQGNASSFLISLSRRTKPL
jgi:hypothetical protein